MTTIAAASRVVQELSALAIPVTGPAPAGRSPMAHMPNSGIYAPPALSNQGLKLISQTNMAFDERLPKG